MTGTNTHSATRITTQQAAQSLPSVIRFGLSAIGFELRAYFRTPDTVIFTFLFPALMLIIFGFAFANVSGMGTSPLGGDGVSVAAYYVPGMAASGFFLLGVMNLAVDIANEKHGGWLRRLGGMPISPLSYFIGKAGLLVITALLQLAVLLATAVVVFQVSLPSDPERWLNFAWISVLGIITMALLGTALSALPRSAKSATASTLR